MDGVISRVVLGLIRHFVAGFFAAWTAKGWLTGDQTQMAITAVMTLVPIAFSVYNAATSQKKEKQ